MRIIIFNLYDKNGRVRVDFDFAPDCLLWTCGVNKVFTLTLLVT